MTDWADLAQRASFASHRLVGWIFWDPGAKENLERLGVPGGLGHYIVNRAAPLAAAGPEVVTAAFFSIKAEFVRFALDHAAPHVDWHEVTVARDAAVRAGLERMAPGIIEPLGALADRLWQTVDEIPSEGRVLFAAHRAWPRPEDPLLSAWNAVNTLREWRGDVHWAILVNDGIDAIEAGVLHDAWMGYPDHWLPKSRGADDRQIGAALGSLDTRGWVTGGRINAAGIAYRQSVEDRTDHLCATVWRTLGEADTVRYLEIVELVGERFLRHIDETAGDFWMPAARRRHR